jgi:hypothetical protein
MLHYLSQSLGKIENDSNRINEDNLKVLEREDKIIAVVSDGAGGEGIYCSMWSKKLVDEIPSTALKSADQIDKWISKFWESFYNEANTLAEDDVWKKLKLNQEGSYATLSAVWIYKEENSFFYEITNYGDSVVMVYQESTNQLILPGEYIDLLRFASDPYLLNWKEESSPEAGFFYQGPSELFESDHIIVASDAMAIYIITNYLISKKNDHSAYTAINQVLSSENALTSYVSHCLIDYKFHSFKEFLNDLKKSLSHPEGFEKYCSQLIRNGKLKNDDLSIIYLQIENPN